MATTARTANTRVNGGWFALALVPALASLLVLGFALHASRVTGSWPSYGSPDPTSLFSPLYAATFVGFLASIPAMLCLLIGLPATRRLRLSRLDIAALFVGVASFTLLILLWSGDLGSWLVD